MSAALADALSGTHCTVAAVCLALADWPGAWTRDSRAAVYVCFIVTQLLTFVDV